MGSTVAGSDVGRTPQPISLAWHAPVPLVQHKRKRPAAPLFRKVRIQPELATLTRAKGTMVHPRGEIAIDVEMRDGKLTGEVRLPEATAGELLVNGNRIELSAESKQTCMMPHPF